MRNDLKLHSAYMRGDIVEVVGRELVRHTIAVVLYDATTTKAHIFIHSLN